MPPQPRAEETPKQKIPPPTTPKSTRAETPVPSSTIATYALSDLIGQSYAPRDDPGNIRKWNQDHNAAWYSVRAEPGKRTAAGWELPVTRVDPQTVSVKINTKMDGDAVRLLFGKGKTARTAYCKPNAETKIALDEGFRGPVQYELVKELRQGKTVDLYVLASGKDLQFSYTTISPIATEPAVRKLTEIAQHTPKEKPPMQQYAFHDEAKVPKRRVPYGISHHTAKALKANLQNYAGMQTPQSESPHTIYHLPSPQPHASHDLAQRLEAMLAQIQVGRRELELLGYA